MLASGVPNCKVELEASYCSEHWSWEVENLLLIVQDKECLFNSVLLVRNPSSLCLPSWHHSCDKCRWGLPPPCLDVVRNQKLWWACSQDDLNKSTFSTLDTNWLSLKTRNILSILNLLMGSVNANFKKDSLSDSLSEFFWKVAYWLTQCCFPERFTQRVYIFRSLIVLYSSFCWPALINVTFHLPSYAATHQPTLRLVASC